MKNTPQTTTGTAVSAADPALSFRPDGTLVGHDASISTAASRLIALHERGAASGQVLCACQDLMSATEGELLRRERTMMALGEPDLAVHVRRHGDILLKLGQQLRELRREGKGLSPHFLRFIHGLLDMELRPVMSSSAPRALPA